MNSLSDRYREIRNALEYGGQDLTVDIIISSLSNRELELKVESKDSRYGKDLHIKEKQNQNKKNAMCNFNSHKRGKPQNSKFRDKNRNQVKSKNQIRKCYYCGKTGYLIKNCFKKLSDTKEKQNFNGSTAIVCKGEPNIQGVVLVNTINRFPKWVGFRFWVHLSYVPH